MNVDCYWGKLFKAKLFLIENANKNSKSYFSIDLAELLRLRNLLIRIYSSIEMKIYTMVLVQIATDIMYLPLIIGYINKIPREFLFWDVDVDVHSMTLKHVRNRKF